MRSGLSMMAWGLGAALCVGCHSPGPTPAEAIGDYIDAVQARDLGRLYCLVAGAADRPDQRGGFEAWAGEGYEAYLDGRDRGRVALRGDGIALVKLFALGRGTFHQIEHTVDAGADARRVRSRIRFGYSHMDLSRFSPGTILYMNGIPVGSVETLRVPRDSRQLELEVLSTVALEWTLISRPAGDECPAGWAVASVEVIRGTATSAEVAWTF